MLKKHKGGIQLKLINEAVVEEQTLNRELVGRRFFDGRFNVRVIGTHHSNPAHVLVERETCGLSWSVPAALIRLIVGRECRKRVA